MMAQLHPRLTHPSRREPGRNGGSLGLQGALGPHQEGSGLSLELPRRELVYLRVGFVPPWATGVGDREALEPSVPGQPYLVDEAVHEPHVHPADICSKAGQGVLRAYRPCQKPISGPCTATLRGGGHAVHGPAQPELTPGRPQEKANEACRKPTPRSSHGTAPLGGATVVLTCPFNLGRALPRMCL